MGTLRRRTFPGARGAPPELAVPYARHTSDGTAGVGPQPRVTASWPVPSALSTRGGGGCAALERAVGFISLMAILHLLC